MSRDHSCGKGRGLSIRLRLVSPSACSLVWHRVGMSRLGCGPLYQVAFGVSKCMFTSLVSSWVVEKAFPWGGMQLLYQTGSGVSCMFNRLASCLDVNHLGKRWKKCWKTFPLSLYWNVKNAFHWLLQWARGKTESWSVFSA